MTPPEVPMSSPPLDFMKAVWSVWLGNADQPQLGEALVARL